MKLEDFHSGTWRRLTQLIDARVDELRKLNDNMSCGLEKTSAIRGGIAELNRILALAEDAGADQAVTTDALVGADMPDFDTEVVSYESHP